MSIVNAKEIMIEGAKNGGYAVGAFNITDLVQFEAVIDAAIEKKAPVIVQTSVKPSQVPRHEMVWWPSIVHWLVRAQFQSACTSITPRRLPTVKNAQTQATPTS